MTLEGHRNYVNDLKVQYAELSERASKIHSELYTAKVALWRAELLAIMDDENATYRTEDVQHGLIYPRHERTRDDMVEELVSWLDHVDNIAGGEPCFDPYTVRVGIGRDDETLVQIIKVEADNDNG